MPKKFDWNKDIDELTMRVEPLLDEVDLETHVPLSFDMDDPLRLKSKIDIPERIQKLGVLFDQRKIDISEYRRLLKVENQGKNKEWWKAHIGNSKIT